MSAKAMKTADDGLNMSQALARDFLVEAARLLLEYNASTEAVCRPVSATARALTGRPCVVGVSYRSVTISLPGEPPAIGPVNELRYNTAVQQRVHNVLAEVRRGKLDAAAGLAQLANVEADAPGHSDWAVSVALGAGGMCLAVLLGADRDTAIVVGLASALGLLARRWLGRRKFSLLTLPFTAALIGAILGGLAIRLGVAAPAELVIIVPALVLIPGPHLINGIMDLVDNQVPMGVARLTLATGIILASAAGVAVGVELTLSDGVQPAPAGASDRLTLLTDMALAAVVACGFAVFYNTPWRLTGMVVVCGAVGHGLRFLALGDGYRPEVATFLGGLVVGLGSAWMARGSRAPVAVIAFAGAVTMIPGSTMYRTLACARQLVRPADPARAEAVVDLLANGLRASLAVGALALGLVLGVRVVEALAGDMVEAAASGGPH